MNDGMVEKKTKKNQFAVKQQTNYYAQLFDKIVYDYEFNRRNLNFGYSLWTIDKQLYTQREYGRGGAVLTSLYQA